MVLDSSAVVAMIFAEPESLVFATAVQRGRDQAEAARDAYRRYGKGVHPARLNFGDCCSYALAVVSGEPLLFKGADFRQTDVQVVQLNP